MDVLSTSSLPLSHDPKGQLLWWDAGKGRFRVGVKGETKRAGEGYPGERG